MKKINIVKKNNDFSRIIKTGKKYSSKYYLIFIEYGNFDKYHFGLSVSKKVGNAVMRNKIKRRLKNILDKKDFKKDFNCIIIVKRGIEEITFQEMESDLLNLIERLHITEGENNEKEIY